MSTVAPRPRSGADRRSGPDLVVRHLEDLILDSGLAPGDELPSESEVAADLDVSRLTVREGVKILAARGLVDVQRGRRSTVAHTTSEPLSAFFGAAVRRDPEALMELLDVRFAIESSASALAAEHADDDERAAIGHALERMREARRDGVAFNAADFDFHALIAAASHNRMFDLLMQGMEEPLRASRLESLRGHIASHGPEIDDFIAEHQEILEAILDRDSARAAAAMRRHLRGTRRDILTATRIPATDAAAPVPPPTTPSAER